MDFNRAQEILKSEEIIKVVYNGTAVWIESLDPANQTALVSSQDFANMTQPIPVKQLIEAGS